jgi:hypothetical protein
MMTEADYQAKIIKELEKFGGIAVNGIYTKKGEADLQCGISWGGQLLHLAIEVKSKKAYEKLMSGIAVNDEGLYEIVDKSKLDTREVLQLHKINRNRELGGHALFAYEFSQVLEYMEENYHDN